MYIEKPERIEEFSEDFVIKVLKSYKVDIDDLNRIERVTKMNLNGHCTPQYKKKIKNLNLAYEVFKYSENAEGNISLLGLIYKFESIFEADATTLMVNILNRYYTNIHFYLPVSRRTFLTVKNDLIRRLNRIPRIGRRLISCSPPDELDLTKENFIINDRIAGKVIVPIIVRKQHLGLLIFYYVDYKTKKNRLELLEI